VVTSPKQRRLEVIVVPSAPVHQVAEQVAK